MDYSTLPLFSLQPETKEIPLSGKRGRGKVAIVDAADYEWLVRYKWHCSPNQRTDYAQTQVHGKRILMHRLITSAPDGSEVDHRDGNGLHNTRSNLRVATKLQNSYNQGMQRNNKSGYKGVCWHAHGRKWHVQIQVNGKKVHLGYYAGVEEAARVYDDAARKYHGEFARLNFE